MSGTTLIMGGSGTIGSYLVRELLPDRERLNIVAAARSPKSAQHFARLGCATVALDLDRTESLAPAMAGVSTLFMLKPYSIDYLIQSKRVIDAARKAGVQHIVNLGSFGADDTPWTSIGWNRLVEAYLQVSGMHYTHLRPNFFMDNVPKRTDHTSGQIVHYFGPTAVSWIAAQDIAAVAAVVLRDSTGGGGTQHGGHRRHCNPCHRAGTQRHLRAARARARANAAGGLDGSLCAPVHRLYASHCRRPGCRSGRYH
jgi:NAD(P)H dehydrogenase (quinone)